MLILLPPSERKTPARRGAPVDLAGLSFPALTETRAAVLETLVRLCRDQPAAAAAALGLGSGHEQALAGNAALLRAPAVAVERLYCGVLYDALDLAGLQGVARRRARAWLVVISGAWGALRPTDRVPAYKLPIDARLPGLPPLGALWRPGLAEVLPDAAGDGLVVDMRSSGYVGAWPPAGELARRTVAVRVLREREGTRSVVSHMAKHYRGLLARHLLDGPSPPTDPVGLAERAAQRWRVELVEPPGPRPRVLNLVVDD